MRSKASKSSSSSAASMAMAMAMAMAELVAVGSLCVARVFGDDKMASISMHIFYDHRPIK
jgi:hypothetical protein